MSGHPSGAGEILARTPLYGLHVEQGGKMVPFAGYDMPVQYPAGILAEHLHTRAQASLFDVSHMGQVRLEGPDAARELERLVPADIAGLGAGQTRYTLFTNDQGGILDDLMVTNAGDHLFLVVNAACKAADIAHLKAHLSCPVVVLEDRALIALQGPQAVDALAALAPECHEMRFMTARPLTVDGVACFATRSGYTGEDGFEISVPAAEADRLARRLIALPGVALAGLGARDSLRLEAGLCLYGSDIDTTTTPIEAGLAWTIGKRRREEGGFPGAAVILEQLKTGAPRKRVGILPKEKAPARAHTEIVDTAGARIGEVTSGGFAPSLNGPVAMGYVDAAHAAKGTEIGLKIRGHIRPAVVAGMEFVPHRYVKG